MRRALVAAAATALAVPGAALAKTTKVDAYTTQPERSSEVFRRGDPIHVLARRFIPDAVCGARVKFTLVDSAGKSFVIGRAHPGFGRLGEGLVDRKLEAVPDRAAFGWAKVKSKQDCGLAGTASGDDRVLIVDPSRPLPNVLATSAPDGLSGEKIPLSFRIDRDAEVTVDVQYEFVPGDWRPVDSVVTRKFFKEGGSYELEWRADAGGPVPPGSYRFVVTPRAPTVADGATVLEEFLVAREVARGLARPAGPQLSQNGALVVAEAGRNRLVSVTSGGTSVYDGFQLNDPRDLAFVGPAEYLVVNSGSRRILRHRRSGRTVETSLFAGPEHFSPARGPQAVAATALGGGRVYAVDGDLPRVQVFDGAGRAAGAFTAGAGVLDDPQGVAVGPDGSVWVSDSRTAKLVQFSAVGALLRQVALRGRPGIGQRTPGGRPVAVDVDRRGRVVFVDAAARHAGVVRSAGVVTPAGTGLLREPAGIAAAGSAGDFYVTDAGSGRVLWFRVP